MADVPALHVVEGTRAYKRKVFQVVDESGGGEDKDRCIAPWRF